MMYFIWTNFFLHRRMLCVKFGRNYLAHLFWLQRWKCENSTRTHGHTDRQTDIGQQVIKKAYLNFQQNSRGGGMFPLQRFRIVPTVCRKHCFDIRLQISVVDPIWQGLYCQLQYPLHDINSTNLQSRNIKFPWNIGLLT